jgi:Transglycosylase SLT domain
MTPTLLLLSFRALLLMALVCLTLVPPCASWADSQTSPSSSLLMPGLAELSPAFPHSGEVLQAIPLQPSAPFAQAQFASPPIPARLMAEAVSPHAAMARWNQEASGPMAPLPFETQLVRLDFKEAELPPASPANDTSLTNRMAPVPTAALPGDGGLSDQGVDVPLVATSSALASTVLDAQAPPRRGLGQRLFGWLRRTPNQDASTQASEPTPQGGHSSPQNQIPLPTATGHFRVDGLDMQTVHVSRNNRAASAATQWVELQVLTANPLPLNSLARTVKTYNKVWSDEYVQQMAKLIVELGAQQSVDYKLLASIIAVESSFRMNAVSPTGAMGLGQLLPATARWLQVSNPFDPVDNAMAVSRYLRYLQNAFPNEQDKAVASYFVGQGTVKRSGISPSAQAYVNKVATVYKQLEQQ